MTLPLRKMGVTFQSEHFESYFYYYLSPFQKFCSSACAISSSSVLLQTLKNYRISRTDYSTIHPQKLTLTVPWEFCHPSDACSVWGSCLTVSVFAHTEKCAQHSRPPPWSFIFRDRGHNQRQEEWRPLLLTGPCLFHSGRPFGTKSMWQATVKIRYISNVPQWTCIFL